MEFCNSIGDDGGNLRRGPWTREEDNLLTRYIAFHGEGRWDLLAKRAGLKRNGKSCRLRWLNYLKPDVRRGNLTAEEQLLILKLHHKWGNRWSKIAQYLPGRTDNEIKNYWRTRVQKHARQLNIDSNNKRFMDTLCGYWIPRLYPTTTAQDMTPQQTRTHSATTSMQSLTDTTTLLSHSTISSDSSSTGLTSSSSEGNNSPGYGFGQHKSGTGLVGNDILYQQDFCDGYLDEFNTECYYKADELLPILTELGDCDAFTSGSQADAAAEGVDVDYDIWQLRNSDSMGF